MSNCSLWSKGLVECSFCHKKHSIHRSAEWHAGPNITCCHDCAQNVLPVLMADTLMLQPGESAAHLADKFWAGPAKAAFLRALLCRCAPKVLPSEDIE